jgi:hypothetical protein
VFNLAPHFGQRRFLCFMTHVVRGRIPMTTFSPDHELGDDLPPIP